MSGTTPDFNIATYTNLPYLNVNQDKDISLNTLFDYDPLTIPGGEGGEEFYILNIKKQFICISYNDLSSGIYVKKAIIDETDLSVIKTKSEKIEFASKLNETVTINSSNLDGSGRLLFNKVYQKINPRERPYLSSVSDSTFRGGRKGGGTRKAGGSRSR